MKMITRLLCMIVFAFFIAAPSVLLAGDDPGSLIDEYLKASWLGQDPLRNKIVESAGTVLPVAAARLKEEGFTRRKAQRPSCHSSNTALLANSDAGGGAVHSIRSGRGQH